ncbi:MAG TPA: ribosome small subunit-dependent GTPase A [Firmicutes bacterium]|nr:ribosome small subunit-dependent GTPase A [Bacillota bacterium]
MQEGTVVKAVGGFFFVDTPAGEYRCYLRGRIKRDLVILVGDRVKIRPVDRENAVIEAVLPRRNSLIRPPIANVDQCIVVAALANPSLNLKLLDRFLVVIQAASLEAIICLNKTDLVPVSEVAPIVNLYRQAGFVVVPTSVRTGAGIETLARLLEDKISVLAGPSGAGKSSLLNTIQPGFSLEVGEISRKLGRGRHTTRHVELLPLPGKGRVADTPGFTSLHLAGIDRRELMYYFPEFIELAPDCRFNPCLHWREPECAVREGVKQGKIDRGRYKHYLDFLQELEG